MADIPANEKDRWTQVLRPSKRIFDFDIRELYRYRDLIWLFVNRDVVTVYKQTILGPLWFVMNPLFTTIIYSFIFGGLAKIPTDGVPQTLFYYGGTMLWGYFSSCFSNVADVFTNNSSLFSKVYFPRLAVPVSKILSSLFATGIQFLCLIFFYLYFVLNGAFVRPTLLAFAIPLLLAQLAALGMGLGMIVSALTTKYRDLRQLVGFGISLWMYATPIVYPISQVPAKYRWIMMINPVSSPVEAFRSACYGVGGPTPMMILTSVAATAVFLFIGLILFSRNERTFIDIV